MTVVACANAASGTIPPMIIFKGKNKRDNFGDALLPLACFEIAEKGSMTHEIFVKWLQHFAKFKSTGKVLLIFDGAECHQLPSIVDEADKYEVTLFCLPSITTHELQPLDVAVIRAFEHYWDEEVLRFWRQRPNRTLSKELFGHLFTPVWNKTMTISNIQSGFQKCGIFPFDGNAIPDHTFAPSDVTNVKVSNQSKDNTSTQFPPTTQVTQDNLVDMQEPSTSQNLSLQPSASQKVFPASQMSPESSTSSDRSSPLSASSTSFCNIMSTPVASSKVKKRSQRKKSINYRATVVSKILFYGKEKKNVRDKNKKKNVVQEKNHVEQTGIVQYARKIQFPT